MYAELGTVPLLYNRLFAIVKFWSKVLYSENCILRNCYEEMYTNCEKYKCKNWAYDVKKILIDLGFNGIWIDKKIDNSMLQIVKTRIFDQAKQDIFSKIEKSRKCIFYKYLIDGLYLQCYLRKSIPVKFQRCISKIRLSSHQLAIEAGRYSNTIRRDRCCRLCVNSIEDEYHFILVCPLFTELRRKFIKEYYYKRPSMFKLIQLFNTENFKDLCNLGKFIYNSFILRECCNPYI